MRYIDPLVLLLFCVVLVLTAEQVATAYARMAAWERVVERLEQPR